MELHLGPTPARDRTATGWLLDADLSGSGSGVASFVPAGFGRYARILHPARVGDRDATWAEIAEWSGEPLRPDSDSKDLLIQADGTEWEDLLGHQRPSEGTSGLDDLRRSRLCDLLAAETSTPDRIWALIDVIQYPRPKHEGVGYLRPTGSRGRGFGRRAESRELEQMRTLQQHSGVEVAGHAFILHRAQLVDDGAVSCSPSFWMLPSYWWPEDHAWLVHTNVDCPTTYVGGSGQLVERLLDDTLLEVVEARLDHPFDGHPV